MWKFKNLSYKKLSEGAPNVLTGEINESITTSTIKGYIVPVSAEDIAKGFQMGSYKCYCQLPDMPTVGKDMIENYKITSVEFWQGKNIFIVGLIK